MPSDCISFQETGFFSSLICDYLDQKNSLENFYNHFPTLENLKFQIKEKQENYPKAHRSVLEQVLTTQYQNTQISEETLQNIKILKEENTFTITTGHQLNLFTGPLYFLYKIISTINFTVQAQKKYPNYNFVPVYWMATEDHDFLEINHFQFQGKKIVWNYPEAQNNDNGYVGEFEPKGLEEVFKNFEKELGIGNNADYLKKLFQKGYLNHSNLAEATRYIVNQLFGKYGLVIVDGNDTQLKKLFIPIIEKELSTSSSYNLVNTVSEKLNHLGYKSQVSPREINLFYGKHKIRARIEKYQSGFRVVDHNIFWRNLEEIKEEIAAFPERFSPNVILRPVYQEVILPNLCYIGGGGEIAYWLQLHSYFQSINLTFPMLMLRNSALLISQKQQQKIANLNLEVPELFMPTSSLINYKVRQISDIKIDFSAQKKALEKQFEELREIALLTDKSFINAVNAQERKQIKGLEKLENRLLKAQKIKLGDHVTRLVEIKNTLFPQESLQERKLNFSEFYLNYGETLIPLLIGKLNPFDSHFRIVFLP